MTYAKAQHQGEDWYGALRRLRTVLINSRVGARKGGEKDGIQAAHECPVTGVMNSAMKGFNQESNRISNCGNFILARGQRVDSRRRDQGQGAREQVISAAKVSNDDGLTRKGRGEAGFQILMREALQGLVRNWG